MVESDMRIASREMMSISAGFGGCKVSNDRLSEGAFSHLFSLCGSDDSHQNMDIYCDQQPDNFCILNRLDASLPHSLQSTSTPVTRTSLRQQVHRRQLAEELRKEGVKMGIGELGAGGVTPDANPLLPSLDVPPQVLQVHSKLENPTRYHVLQSQKRQVREYLSSNRTGLNDNGGPIQSSLPAHAGMSPMPPTAQMFNTTLSDVMTLSVSAPDSNLNMGQLDTSAEMNELLNGLIDLEGNVCGSDGKANSLTNRSQTQNVLLDLDEDSSQFGGSSKSVMSASCPANMTSIKQEPLTETDYKAYVKDRQKKDNHNMIERRRRFNINDRIKELGTLLPKNNEPYYDLVRDVRQNKGTILRASVEYIRRLKRDQHKLMLVEERHKQIDVINKKLMARIEELELLAKAHGVPVTSTQWNQLIPSNLLNSLVLTDRTPEEAVKEEYQRNDDDLLDQSTVDCLNDLMEDDTGELSMHAPPNSYQEHPHFDMLFGSPITSSPQSFDGGLPFSPDSAVDMM